MTRLLARACPRGQLAASASLDESGGVFRWGDAFPIYAVQDDGGMTPVDVALSMGHVEAAKEVMSPFPDPTPRRQIHAKMWPMEIRVYGQVRGRAGFPTWMDFWFSSMCLRAARGSR